MSRVTRCRNIPKKDSPLLSLDEIQMLLYLLLIQFDYRFQDAKYITAFVSFFVVTWKKLKLMVMAISISLSALLFGT